MPCDVPATIGRTWPDVPPSPTPGPDMARTTVSRALIVALAERMGVPATNGDDVLRKALGMSKVTAPMQMERVMEQLQQRGES